VDRHHRGRLPIRRKTFSPFALPEAQPDPTRGVTSGKIVHCITVDRKGRVWFGTNGGAYVYDGKTLTNISERDGLPNNAVGSILEDKSGNIWFGTFTGASVGLMERTSPTSRSKESLKARRSGAFTKVDPGTCGSPPSDLLCTDTTATHSRS
jgi:ligand-binding sensor domain-containing protein